MFIQKKTISGCPLEPAHAECYRQSQTRAQLLFPLPPGSCAQCGAVFYPIPSFSRAYIPPSVGSFHCWRSLKNPQIRFIRIFELLDESIEPFLPCASDPRYQSPTSTSPQFLHWWIFIVACVRWRRLPVPINVSFGWANWVETQCIQVEVLDFCDPLPCCSFRVGTPVWAY